MADGFDVFDRTVQKSTEWIREVCGEMGPPDMQKGYLALRAVLRTLRDRLTVDEAANLGAQLPLLIRGIYYDGYRPSRMPVKISTRDQFLTAVKDCLGGAMPVVPSDEATAAVLTVLQKRITDGEITDIRNMMPQELQGLWPS